MIFFAVAALLISGVRASSTGSQLERRLDVSVDVRSDPDVSYIFIRNSSGDIAGKGWNVSVDLEIYRGVTLKRTVYVWIENCDGQKLSSKEKFSLPVRFTGYFFTANFSFPVSSLCGADGYVVVAEGLDLNVSESLDIIFDACELEDVPITPGKIIFSVDYPEEIFSGVPFSTRVIIENPTDQYLDVDAWSYVYRSSKCYSGEREQNLKTVNLPGFSNVTFDLENTVLAEEGNYSLKVKLLRSDRKTPEEFTFGVRVERVAEIDLGGEPETGVVGGLEMGSSEMIFSGESGFGSPVGERVIVDSNVSRGGVVFQSSSAKARGLIVYFLIAVLALVIIALVFRKF